MKSCESCGMPLEQNTTSIFDPHYCIYCQNQKTGVLKTFEEVRAGSIAAAQRLMHKSEEDAIKMADEMLPTLPRWKK